MVVGGKTKTKDYNTTGEIYDVEKNTWTLMDAEIPYPDYETTSLGGLTIIQKPSQELRVFSVGYESYEGKKMIILELTQDWKNWTYVTHREVIYASHPLSYVVAYNY